MPGPTSRTLTAAAGLAMAASACSAPATREPATPNAAPETAASMNLMPVREWPLKFHRHTFSAHCYDTYGCQVDYAGVQQRDDDSGELRPSSASYGADYQRNWGSGHGGIRNFPGPAEVRWRSKDGTAHEARIDIAALFADEVVRHNVSRDQVVDLPDGVYRLEPTIILEVNDRTIRVWMRAHVGTKALQEPGNRYSDFRSDVILVETYHF